LLFAEFSDLLEQLKTFQPQAEQEGEPRKRRGKSAYCSMFIKEVEQDDEDGQLNEHLVPEVFVVSHIITSQNNQSFL
jgi:hypothetical protein